MFNLLVQIGGLFAVLSFIHFFVDWLFQSHDEAMAKHNNSLIRAKHCFIYTLGFIPLFILLNLSVGLSIILCAILFLSHFIEDTYIPVYLWAKYIRKPAEIKLMDDKYAGFMAFATTPLGKILMIAVDQIIHLFFVMIVAILIAVYGV